MRRDHRLPAKEGSSLLQRILRRGVLVLFSVTLPATHAQTRLEQLEATYQSNLRTLHSPVLQDYLRQLEVLKSKFTAGNRPPADLRHVETEIARVKTIIGTTGIFPYTEVEAVLAPDANAESPKPAPPPKQPPPARLPTLTGAEAFKSLQLDGKTGAVPLGHAEWRLEKLPAGTYDVLIIFSSEPLSLPEQITLSLEGREFNGTIDVNRGTGSIQTFRLLRLCQITLDTDINGGTLSLTGASQHKPLLWVQKLMFAKPRKADPAAAQ